MLPEPDTFPFFLLVIVGAGVVWIGLGEWAHRHFNKRASSEESTDDSGAGSEDPRGVSFTLGAGMVQGVSGEEPGPIEPDEPSRRRQRSYRLQETSLAQIDQAIRDAIAQLGVFPTEIEELARSVLQAKTQSQIGLAIKPFIQEGSYGDTDQLAFSLNLNLPSEILLTIKRATKLGNFEAAIKLLSEHLTVEVAQRSDHEDDENDSMALAQQPITRAGDRSPGDN